MPSSGPREGRHKSDLVGLNRRTSTTAGMWSWLGQRLAAIALIPLILAHLANPYVVQIQFFLVLTVVFHGLLGVRVLLADIGIRAGSGKVMLGILGFIGLAFVLVMGRSLF